MVPLASGGGDCEWRWPLFVTSHMPPCGTLWAPSDVALIHISTVTYPHMHLSTGVTYPQDLSTVFIHISTGFIHRNRKNLSTSSFSTKTYPQKVENDKNLSTDLSTDQLIHRSFFLLYPHDPHIHNSFYLHYSLIHNRQTRTFQLIHTIHKRRLIHTRDLSTYPHDPHIHKTYPQNLSTGTKDSFYRKTPKMIDKN